MKIENKTCAYLVISRFLFYAYGEELSTISLENFIESHITVKSLTNAVIGIGTCGSKGGH